MNARRDQLENLLARVQRNRVTMEEERRLKLQLVSQPTISDSEEPALIETAAELTSVEPAPPVAEPVISEVAVEPLPAGSIDEAISVAPPISEPEPIAFETPSQPEIAVAEVPISEPEPIALTQPSTSPSETDFSDVSVSEPQAEEAPEPIALTQPTAPASEMDFSDVSASEPPVEEPIMEVSTPNSEPVEEDYISKLAGPEEEPHKITVAPEEPVIEISSPQIPAKTEPSVRQFESTTQATDHVVTTISKAPQPLSWTIRAVLERAWKLGDKE